jgi:hypothetical protein
MFHTQDEWRADDGIDVYRALSGVPSLQRFSIVEVFSNTPTFEVELAFLDEEDEQCWRKFLCVRLKHVAEIILRADVVAAKVSINSMGRFKNISVGEPIQEIFRKRLRFESEIFFCKTSSGTFISDEIGDLNIEMQEAPILIWRA